MKSTSTETNPTLFIERGRKTSRDLAAWHSIFKLATPNLDLRDTPEPSGFAPRGVTLGRVGFGLPA